MFERKSSQTSGLNTWRSLRVELLLRGCNEGDPQEEQLLLLTKVAREILQNINSSPDVLWCREGSVSHQSAADYARRLARAEFLLTVGPQDREEQLLLINSALQIVAEINRSEDVFWSMEGSATANTRCVVDTPRHFVEYWD